MPRTRALTLGKFAPLHRGHQYLIETALSECDEVAVIIYDCPETTPIPLNIRAEWIRRLYPTVTVVEAWDGPVEVGDTPEIRERHERYIIEELKISGITHFYSGEFYGAHMSRALGAVDRRVDPSRANVPASGTAIRSNPYRYRGFVDPLVYRELIANVVFLGGPSTGKTTLAEQMAAAWGTVWMPEYGREYWDLHQQNRRLSLDQLVELAERHLEREDEALARANRFLFTDTNALTTYIFSIYYHDTAAPRLRQLADQTASRYDLVFLCGDDIPYDDTWDRSGAGNRAVLQKRTVGELAARNIPFVELRGSLDERIRRASAALAGYEKYTNWWGSRR